MRLLHCVDLLFLPTDDRHRLLCGPPPQLYGNPLEYLPELAPAVGLRSLSLANVRIMADAAYTR